MMVVVVVCVRERERERERNRERNIPNIEGALCHMHLSSQYAHLPLLERKSFADLFQRWC
jgi:hypothetical protein